LNPVSATQGHGNKWAKMHRSTLSQKAEAYTDCFVGECAERKNVKNLESKENIIMLPLCLWI